MEAFLTISNFFRGLLESLGLASIERTVVFLGLDNAGKTTLLHKLKHGSVRQFVPTERAMSEEVTIGKMTVQAWDCGGHAQVRRLWLDYYAEADAIIFVVDADDRSRFPEARDELQNLLADDLLNNVPIAVLGNKADIKSAASLDELAVGLQINDLSSHNRRPLRMFRSSIVEGWGFVDAFKWVQSLD